MASKLFIWEQEDNALPQLRAFFMPGIEATKRRCTPVVMTVMVWPSSQMVVLTAGKAAPLFFVAANLFKMSKLPNDATPGTQPDNIPVVMVSTSTYEHHGTLLSVCDLNKDLEPDECPDALVIKVKSLGDFVLTYADSLALAGRLLRICKKQRP